MSASPVAVRREGAVATPRDAHALERALHVTRVMYERNAQLEQALGSRVVIEQAKGVLAERLGIGVDAAFDVLRRAARSNRMKLRTLAERVVASPTTPREIEAVATTASHEPKTA